MSLRTVVEGSIAALFVVMFVTVNLRTAVTDGRASFGEPDAPATHAELPGISQHRIMSQFAKIPAECGGASIVSDAETSALAKIEASYSPPCPIFFMAEYLGPYQLSFYDSNVGPIHRLLLSSAYKRTLGDHINFLNGQYSRFKIRNAPSSYEIDDFRTEARLKLIFEGRDPNAMFLESPNPLLFNAWQGIDTKHIEAKLRPWSSVHNYLVLAATVRSGYGYTIWRFEPDYFFPGREMEAVGRYVTWFVVNPRPRSRLVIDFTGTLDANGNDDIPPISIIGSKKTQVAVVGRGAARLISEPLSPQLVDGVFPILQMDMGEDGFGFRNEKTGLMRLFGTSLNDDPRRLNGFIRDVSLVTESQYEAMHAPARLDRFPSDLANPGLEFSGMYEDGWISEHAQFVLSDPPGAKTLSVSGLIPNIFTGGVVTVDLLVDGVSVAQSGAKVGVFKISAPALGDGLKHRVDLRFGETFRLPGDGRVASMLLHSIGYE